MLRPRPDVYRRARLQQTAYNNTPRISRTQRARISTHTRIQAPKRYPHRKEPAQTFPLLCQPLVPTSRSKVSKTSSFKAAGHRISIKFFEHLSRTLTPCFGFTLSSLLRFPQPWRYSRRPGIMKRSWHSSQDTVREYSSVQFTTAAFSGLRVEENTSNAKDQVSGSKQNIEESIPSTAPALDIDSSSEHINLPEPLVYQIPQETLKQALDDRANGETVYWSYHLYCNEKDAKKRPPVVHYCRKKEFVEQICQHFINDELLGFDLEWMPNAYRGSPKQMVSLIQLANAERIALFHIALHRESEDLIAPTLKKILENPNIRKVGVAISGDSTRLRKTFGVDSKSLFELSHLHKLVRHFHEPQLINRRLVSLTNQVEMHLQLPLEKEEVRESDWTKELDIVQIRYAANDAYASVRLFDELNRKRLALKPTPPLPHMAELKLPIRLAEEEESSSESDEIMEEEFDEENFPDSDESAEPSYSQPPTPQAAPKRRSRRRTSEATPRVEPTEPPTPAEVLLANEWVASYLAHRPSTSRKPPSTAPLRAYSLWQQQGMDVSEIANLLRKPPLASATVATYIIQCIHQEELECDTARARTVLERVPDSVLAKRYWRRRLEARDPSD